MIAPRLGLLAVVLTACATGRYSPTGGPFIAISMDGGMQKYQSNGRTYDSLGDAMAHDPEAHTLLKRGESDFLLGGLLAIGGSVLLGLGSTEVIFQSVDDSLFGTTSPVLGLAMLGAGLAGSIAGIGYAASGERDRLDAINMFNDHELLRWLERRDAERARTPTP